MIDSGEDSYKFALSLREQVNKQMETLRQQGIVGKSLQTEVTLHLADDNEFRMALEVGGSTGLAELFSVSDVFILVKGTREVFINKSEHTACERCWRHVATDKHTYWPEDTLCTRCVQALLEVIHKYPPYRMYEGRRVYVSEHDVLNNNSQYKLGENNAY